MVGVGFRGAVAVLGVLLLAAAVKRAGVPLDRFLGWVDAFYIIILTVDAALSARAARAGGLTAGG